MMRGVLRGSALLLGLVVSMALNLSGCWDHCECPDVQKIYFEDPGTYVFYDIVEEDFSGSPDSFEYYTWAESTWADVLEGEFEISGDDVVVRYSTEEASFVVTFDVLDREAPD